MYSIGDNITILPPFQEFFPDVYVINRIEGTTVWLDSVESAFDFCFLNKV